MVRCSGPLYLKVSPRRDPHQHILINVKDCKTKNATNQFSFLVLGASVKADEEEFLKVLESRTKNGDGKLKIVDVNKKENDIEVKELLTLSKVMESLKAKYPGLTHNRIPVCNSAAPLESDFDTICNALLGTNVNAPVIVNCQVIFV